jgi:hypothetical protein
MCVVVVVCAVAARATFVSATAAETEKRVNDQRSSIIGTCLYTFVTKGNSQLIHSYEKSLIKRTEEVIIAFFLFFRVVEVPVESKSNQFPSVVSSWRLKRHFELSTREILWKRVT